MNTEQLRQQLVDRIAKVKREHTEQRESTDRCRHIKKKFKETIVGDNNKFDGQAYFIYTACLECKTKELKDYCIIKT